MKESCFSHSAEKTREHARCVAEEVLPGAIILLEGDLGVGKTEWVKGFVAALGGPSEVTSPTFNLVHEYPCDKSTVFHWDLYRLEKTSDWSVLDLETHLKGPAITLVEWPERYPGTWPKKALKIYFRRISETKREIVCLY